MEKEKEKKEKIVDLEDLDEIKKKPSKKKTEKKRERVEEEIKEEPKKKRKTTDQGDSDEKRKEKSDKSPATTGGINQRNAILFTRRKVSQSEDEQSKKDEVNKGELSSSRRRCSQDENVEPQLDEFEFNETGSTPPPKSPKSLKKKTKSKRGKGPGPDSPTKAVDTSLFQTYRQGGALDTDTDTGNDDTKQSTGWCSSQ